MFLPTRASGITSRQAASIGSSMTSRPWARNSVTAVSVLLPHLLLRVFGPLALEQHDGARPVGRVGDPPIEHLFVEGDHQVGGLAAVGDLVAAEAHPDARGPGARARRRFDLCRNDLDRPDTVADLGADGAEGLTGFLGAFSGVGDDLDDALLRNDAWWWAAGGDRRRKSVSLVVDIGFPRSLGGGRLGAAAAQIGIERFAEEALLFGFVAGAGSRQGG